MVTHPDEYCMCTNWTDWDGATLWHIHITPTGIEAIPRSLKSEFGLRLIRHHKSIWAEDHPFITVIISTRAGDPHRPAGSREHDQR